jgi:carboxylate-amine ligase
LKAKTLALFEGYGIEIESAVVDADSLDVRSVVDELLREAAGSDEWVEDVDDGAIGLSNELVSHVVELKTNGPAPGYAGLAESFRASAARLNHLLREKWNARLMPSGMHPWMDPKLETRIWPHENGPIYRAYDQLFDCRRHGWANVQSVHLNLSFSGEDEFARLMAAVRLALPLIPALAASSPIVEGHSTGLLDSRIDFYRTNSARIPSIAGAVIPEPVFDFGEYEERVFRSIDRELEAIGADAALIGNEWTNARGAIARFDRMAIEVRLIDAQECAAADLAVAAALSGLIRALVEERWSSFKSQAAWTTEALVQPLLSAIPLGPDAKIEDKRYAEAFGVKFTDSLCMGELWQRIVEKTFQGPPELEAALQVILREGTLAQRILSALGSGFDREKLHSVYGELCDCLDSGRSFLP